MRCSDKVKITNWAYSLVTLRYFGNTDTSVVGISVSGSRERTEERMRAVLDMICDETGIAKDFINDSEIIVYDDYIGEGYGRPTDAGIAAIRSVGQHEGVILDPVYTGKCMSAFLDMAGNDKLDDMNDIVFLHTGGAPAIHPYAGFFAD